MFDLLKIISLFLTKLLFLSITELLVLLILFLFEFYLNCEQDFGCFDEDRLPGYASRLRNLTFEPCSS